MPYRTVPFVTGYYYHLYNRGLSKKAIFSTPRTYQRFINTFSYYQIQNPKPKFSLYYPSSLYKIDPTKKIVEILCYCLMPNHFHLLVKQVQDNGISEFIRKFIHSYTKYWNTKCENQGPLMSAMCKAVLVESDEQLLHLSRYIHLNPLVSGLVKDLRDYPWSSYSAFTKNCSPSTVSQDKILQFFKSTQDYENFISDQADYGRTLEILKHASTFDMED